MNRHSDPGPKQGGNARPWLAMAIAGAVGLGWVGPRDDLLAADPDPVFQTAILEQTDGQVISFDEMRGQVVVVNFWASWCKPCRKELPVLQQWRDELGGRGVEFVTISVDHDARKMERFMDREGLTLPVVHDGPEGLAKQLDLPNLPCTYVLDSRGEVAMVSTGGDAADLAKVHLRIEELVNEGSTLRATASSSPGALTP